MELYLLYLSFFAPWYMDTLNSLLVPLQNIPHEGIHIIPPNKTKLMEITFVIVGEFLRDGWTYLRFIVSEVSKVMDTWKTAIPSCSFVTSE